MRKRLLGIAAGLILLILAVIGIINFFSSPAEKRARTYFGIPGNTPVTESALRDAFLRAIPLGTGEPEVRAALVRLGVGRERLTRYYPPDREGTAVVRIERDPSSFHFVHTHYSVLLGFDSTSHLRRVEARKWRTGW